jgi:hypothetical protein
MWPAEDVERRRYFLPELRRPLAPLESSGVVRNLQWVALGVAGLLILYYARFFALVRQDPATLVQIGLLLIACAIVVAPPRGSWRLTPVQRSALAAIAVGVCAVIMVWSDQGSHSASDTLNRAVPAMCVVVASLIWIGRERTLSRQTR